MKLVIEDKAILKAIIKENRAEVEKMMEERGWHTYYNPDYWVNRKCIQDPMAQDYTNYGMPLEMAVEYELNGEKAFGRNPLAGLFGCGAMR